jgi:hypothetical protein
MQNQLHDSTFDGLGGANKSPISGSSKLFFEVVINLISPL